MVALKLKLVRVEKLVVKLLDAHTKGLIDEETKLMAENIKDELFFADDDDDETPLSALVAPPGLGAGSSSAASSSASGPGKKRALDL